MGAQENDENMRFLLTELQEVISMNKKRFGFLFKTCPICGCNFEATSASQKYCAGCRKAREYERRHKEHKK